MVSDKVYWLAGFLTSPTPTTINATLSLRNASGSKLSLGINIEKRLFSVCKCSNTNQGLVIELPNSLASISPPVDRRNIHDPSGLSCNPAISGPFLRCLKASHKLNRTQRESSSLSQISNKLAQAATKASAWTASRKTASEWEGLGAR